MVNYLDVTYNKKLRFKTNYDTSFVEHLIKQFNLKPGKFLDIGCGTQNIMKLFKEKGFDVYGADIINPKEKSEFDIRCNNFETENLKFDTNEFDVVFCKSVVEHLRNPENIIKDAQRVLKPGGTIIVLTPSWLHTYWGPFYIDHTHVTPFMVSSLNKLLLLGDFDVYSTKEFYQFPIVWKLPFLKYICKFIALFPIPYFPVHYVQKKYNDTLNILIRFSNEPMILAHAKKKN